MAERTFDIAEVDVEKSYVFRLFNLWDVGRECCIPAIVEKYERDTHTATVRPLVNHVQKESGKRYSLARSAVSVPAWHLCQGGIDIDIPLFRGDTGWLIAGDRNAVTAMESNRAVLLEDQKEFKTEVEEGEEFQSSSGADVTSEEEPKENKGIQDVDDFDRNKFAFGFFFPASWMHGELTVEDGIVISYTPKEEEGSAPVKVTVKKDGIEFLRGDKEKKNVLVKVNEEEVSIFRGEGEEDGDKIILNDDGLKYEGEEDRKVDVVTNLRYDVSTHQIQKKTVVQKIRGDFVVGVGEESDWMMIDGGQAVPEQTS